MDEMTGDINEALNGPLKEVSAKILHILGHQTQVMVEISALMSEREPGSICLNNALTRLEESSMWLKRYLEISAIAHCREKVSGQMQ